MFSPNVIEKVSNFKITLTKEKEMILTRGLRNWEFESEDGSPLPITYDNIRQLTRKDGDFLHASIRRIYEFKVKDEDKKK